MQKTIISDTSCLIILDKIGEFHLLQRLYGLIITTHEVAMEYGNPLPDWVEIRQPNNLNYQTIIGASIDEGEASAIALALELDNVLLILDDLKARDFATKLGIKITGTLGILVDAKLAGHIASLRVVFEKIRKTNFRLSEKLEKAALARVSE